VPAGSGHALAVAGVNAGAVVVVVAGRQHHLSTGETNRTRAKSEATRIYAEVVSGRKAVTTTPEGVEVHTKQPLVELFAVWLAEEVEPKLDVTTFQVYKGYVRRYVPFFGTLDVLAAGTEDYVRARLRQVKRKTIFKELSALRGALAFFVEQGWLSMAPEVKSPNRRSTGTPDTKKPHKSEPVILEEDEVLAILEQLPDSYRSAPVRARFTFMWETALRPETVAQIRVPDDYRKGQRELRIREEADKSRYARTIPLSERARTALDEKCPARGTIFGRHDFRGILRKAAKDAGLPAEKAKRLSAYDFRHSRATHLVGHSRNLAGVAFLLGHKEITTLNRYVRPGQQAAEKVLAQVAGGAPVMAPEVDSEGASKDVVSTGEVASSGDGGKPPSRLSRPRSGGVFYEHSTSTSCFVGYLPSRKPLVDPANEGETTKRKRPPDEGDRCNAKGGTRPYVKNSSRRAEAKPKPAGWNF